MVAPIELYLKLKTAHLDKALHYTEIHSGNENCPKSTEVESVSGKTGGQNLDSKFSALWDTPHPLQALRSFIPTKEASHPLSAQGSLGRLLTWVAMVWDPSVTSTVKL